ncbi:Type I restriction-modification system, specificity subunit S [Qipengyuania citrea LAMA 915]|jgi:type I restriction enzyme, S subunit|uniref:Type I restriction-modification system, specificity subunit S n=1 Tax=Qipengyuania citrea LAMA 915 TaxID=1306953 RepID=A0A0L1KA72_9SPHN|nr:restriction endonuclease subunit S [Qipengyuania citrea]KNH00784.1 Type I restriction-modification system, specificity subunit S [Qipengyuania citrea LAMA 915]
MAGDAPAELYAPAFNFGTEPVPLIELADWFNGLAFKNIDFSTDGLPVVKIAEIKNGISDSTKRTQADYDPRVRLADGDLLFCWSGQPETSIGTFIWSQGDAWLNQHIFRVVAKETVDPDFLHFLMLYLQPNFQAIAANKQTTGLGHVTKRDLGDMLVQLPDNAEQLRIVEVLQPIQERIALASNLIATLQETAKALFQSWFIDFDPVHAKAAGHDPGLPADVADLFPDQFGDDGLPEGWTWQHLEEVLTLNYGKSLPATARIPGSFPVYGSGGITGFHDEPLYRGPGIIVGRKGTVGKLYWEKGSFFAIDTVFYVTPLTELPLHFLWELLHSFNLGDMNTDAAVPGLNRTNVYRLEFGCPPSALVKTFTDFATHARLKIDHLESLAEADRCLRDTILPRLISGELRIADVANAVAAA